MDDVVAMQFLVAGKVQGVWFRASTREQAQALGLRGHARNLDDGRVEVVAIGNFDAIAKLQRWLQYGPPNARVESVESAFAETDGAVDGFLIS